MTDDAADGKLRRALDLGVDLLGAAAGGMFGAGAGADLGLSAIASMAGTSIASIGHDVVERVLSPRQEARVGAVIFQAAAALAAKEVMGGKIRDDGFWEGDHSAGTEFAEGVILAAMDSFEERKILYLGNVLANVAIQPNIDPATANRAIRMSREISWIEMCLIGIVERPVEFALPEEDLPKATQWDNWTVKAALNGMTGDSGLLKYERIETSEGIPSFDLRLNALSVTSSGDLIRFLMELKEIPAVDLKPVYEKLLSRPDHEVE
jgi:hypothetical protein